MKKLGVNKKRRANVEQVSACAVVVLLHSVECLSVGGEDKCWLWSSSVQTVWGLVCLFRTQKLSLQWPRGSQWGRWTIVQGLWRRLTRVTTFHHGRWLRNHTWHESSSRSNTGNCSYSEAASCDPVMSAFCLLKYLTVELADNQVEQTVIDKQRWKLSLHLSLSGEKQQRCWVYLLIGEISLM